MNRNDLKTHNPVFIKTKQVEAYKEHFIEVMSKAFEKPHYVGMAMEAEYVLTDLMGVSQKEIQELHTKALQVQSKDVELLKDSINKGAETTNNNDETMMEEKKDDH